MSSATWDPALYLDFDDHRARPFHDLLARVRIPAPRRVVDLGCGPGHLTSVLAARWPEAIIEALDSSPDMVAAARAAGVEAREQAVEDWRPEPDTDVVVTNAVLQWVPTHRTLIPRWIAALPPRATLAMQVPGNFGALSHTLIHDLVAEWDTPITLRAEVAVGEPAEYAELVSGTGAVADVWETTYMQRLTGQDPVLHWISGTALRPVRDALGEQEYARFADRLAPRLRRAYPAAADGSTWFPFRRIFVVAQKA